MRRPAKQSGTGTRSLFDQKIIYGGFMDDQLEVNKRIVHEWHDLAINQHKPEEAVAKYLGPYYRQHNPGAADGPDAFIAFMKRFVQTYPDFHMELKRMVAEGNYVALHSHLTLKSGDRGTAVVDIFRLENGKIVEHWDVIQEIPGTSANNNTMF
jgi:predicted SnoaL-like aldol condensation-catalyzing enzyme